MKKYLISIVPLAIGILCFILSGVIGSEVLADGTLKEPFFLIPIGYLFLAIGIILGIIILLKRRKVWK